MEVRNLCHIYCMSQRILHFKSDAVISVTEFFGVLLFVFTEDANLRPHIFIGNII